MPDQPKKRISPRIMQAMETRRPGFTERLHRSLSGYGQNPEEGSKTGSAFIQNVEIPEYVPPGNQQGAHEDVNQRGIDELSRISESTSNSELAEELEELEALIEALTDDIASLKELLYGPDGESGGADGGLEERLANACLEYQCESDGTLTITLKTNGETCA